MEWPDLYVNINLLPGTQIKIDQYNTFTVTCCYSADSGAGIPMSLDYFIKIVFKIKPYIISVTTYDPDVRDTLLRYIPENKIVYIGNMVGGGMGSGGTGGKGEIGVGGETGGGGGIGSGGVGVGGGENDNDGISSGGSIVDVGGFGGGVGSGSEEGSGDYGGLRFR